MLILVFITVSQSSARTRCEYFEPYPTTTPPRTRSYANIAFLEQCKPKVDLHQYAQKDNILSVLCRNADRNARNLALLCEADVFASKSRLSPRLPSSPRVYALDVVFALKNAPLAPSTSSICQPISNRMSPIATLPTALSFIDCPHRDQDKYWVWLDPTASERVLLSRSLAAS